MEAELKALIASTLVIQEELLHDEYDLARDGGMDSLPGMDLSFDIEKKFKVTFPSEQLPRTYGDIRRLLSC
jgi:acyl carrier protein